MGLDMYLYGVNYYSKYEKDNAGNNVRNKTKILKTEEMYWRKANAIHNWFVENCQFGEDDCKPHEVSIEQLKELKALCEYVLKNNNLAEELLPTREGPFFGSYCYNDDYFEDLKGTVKGLNKLLQNEDEFDWFEYCSSW